MKALFAARAAGRSAAPVLAAALCLSALAAPASATIFVGTQTGFVTNSVDNDGLFGLGLFDSGEAYTAVFTYDTSIGLYTDNGTDDDVAGLGPDSPLSATLTINGVSVPAGGDRGAVGAGNSGGLDSIGISGDSEIFDPNGFTTYDLFLSASTIANNQGTARVGSPPAGNLCDIFASCGGSLTVYYYNDNQGANALTDGFGFTATSFVITSGGVPEPAGWALMITGFAGVGAAIRRRRAREGLAPAPAHGIAPRQAAR